MHIIVHDLINIAIKFVEYSFPLEVVFLLNNFINLNSSGEV